MLDGQCPNCKIGTMHFCGSFYRCVRCDYQMDTMVTTIRDLRAKDTWTYSGMHLERKSVEKKPRTPQIVNNVNVQIEQLTLF